MSSRGSDVVETMRAGDGSIWNTVDRRGGVSATATAVPGKSEDIRGELASTEVVDSWRGGRCHCWQGCRMTRRGGGVVGNGGVQELADGVPRMRQSCRYEEV